MPTTSKSIHLKNMSKSITLYKFHFIVTLFLSFVASQAQAPKGKLFIIGGGNKDDALLAHLVSISKLEATDYIAVLPMSSEEPDSSFIYFKKQLKVITSNPIVMLNFDKKTAYDQKWTDSLQKAKIIFITGGDQIRFMNIVNNTPIKTTIKQAYQNGSTISGTSAGAAVMCEHMITGNQKLDSKYSGTFDNIRHNNLETTEGLGLIKNVIIDQHFIKRSRYNRLLSALIEFPTHVGIGIDESTAIIVRNNEIEVNGESEVIVVKNPIGIKKYKKNSLISIQSLQMSIYTNGQTFKIQQ
jgi:cyanophycinase